MAKKHRPKRRRNLGASWPFENLPARQPEFITFRAGPYSLTYPSAPGPWPRVKWPERNQWATPVEYVEPWWAPDCPMDDPKAPPAPHNDKEWHGFLVDSPLKDEWLERMNSIPGIAVHYTDTGHGQDELLYPAIAFQMHPDSPPALEIPPSNEKNWRERWKMYEALQARLQGYFDDIAEVDSEPSSDNSRFIAFRLISWLPRVWMTECQFDSWWEQILSRLEHLSAAGWRF